MSLSCNGSANREWPTLREIEFDGGFSMNDSFDEPLEPVLRRSPRNLSTSFRCSPLKGSSSKVRGKLKTVNDSPNQCSTPIRRNSKKRISPVNAQPSLTEVNEELDSMTIKSKVGAKRGPSENNTPLRAQISEFGKDYLARKRTPSLCSKLASTVPHGSVTKTEFDFAGLPEKLRETYVRQRNIKELYEWQKDCLSDQRLLSGKNCIVCLPTGAGKTLVAEVLMLREAILNNKSSILVLPYVAIVQEKMASLSIFEEWFHVRVEEYAATKGRLPPISRRKGASIYVCTIEKANMLINSLIEVDRLDSVGLVVVDELHMLGDGQRGAIIEQMLTKFLHKGIGQIVGMSATLSNIEQLEKFLKAFIFCTDFRPVNLCEQVRIGQVIYKVENGKLIHKQDLPPNRHLSRDQDGVCQLLENVIPDHQVIIFCPTKKNCENVALMIANMVPKHVRAHRFSERERLVTVLKEDMEQVDENMQRILMSGIAYHHSGLTHDERKHIETAYKEGVLCVICATSTLAAGVNLPARRVIIKSPMVGRNSLGKAQYLQMIGRAGRAGFDEIGESFTIVRRGGEERTFRDMLSGPMLSCNSELIHQKELNNFILDIIVLKLATTLHEVLGVVQHTLLYAQKGDEQTKLMSENAVKTLQTEGMLTERESNLLPTALGVASFTANMGPEETPRINLDLMESLNSGMVFSSHFHLLLLISPYDVSCQMDWHLLHQEHRALPASEKNILDRCGLPEKKIVQCILRGTQMGPGTIEMRLYIAMILQHVWRQEHKRIQTEIMYLDFIECNTSFICTH